MYKLLFYFKLETGELRIFIDQTTFLVHSFKGEKETVVLFDYKLLLFLWLE